MKEILMSRVSSNMDKIMGQLIRDNKFRKANKKLTYPTPKVNPRASSVSSVTEICSMKDALQDECRGILQVAFLPEPEEGSNQRTQSGHTGRRHPRCHGKTKGGKEKVQPVCQHQHHTHTVPHRQANCKLQ